MKTLYIESISNALTESREGYHWSVSNYEDLAGGQIELILMQRRIIKTIDPFDILALNTDIEVSNEAELWVPLSPMVSGMKCRKPHVEGRFYSTKIKLGFSALRVRQNHKFYHERGQRPIPKGLKINVDGLIFDDRNDTYRSTCGSNSEEYPDWENFKGWIEVTGTASTHRYEHEDKS